MWENRDAPNTAIGAVWPRGVVNGVTGYAEENGVDVVNSDMQNFKHFEENLIATRESNRYFA